MRITLILTPHKASLTLCASPCCGAGIVQDERLKLQDCGARREAIQRELRFYPGKGVFTAECVLWQFNIAYLGEKLIHLASVAATLSRDTTSSGLYKFVNIFYHGG